MKIITINHGALSNFSYLLICDKTKKAAVIDPCPELELITYQLEKYGAELLYVLNTHGHHDHIGGNCGLKGKLNNIKILMHQSDVSDKACVDSFISDGDLIEIGNVVVKVIHTPGHTQGGVCFLAENSLFTGDTLFVGDSGRTDLKGGHRPTLGKSIIRLMTLPDDTVIYPGHNLGSGETSTIYNEKRHNINAEEYGFKVSP